MKFTPKTEKELYEDKVYPEGQYAFQIISAWDKQSKAGNDMIELKIQVYNNEGKFILVNDYLMESMMFKLLHACEACGLQDKYESGELVADDFIDKTGFLKLNIQKDKTGQYPDRNGVKDYVVKVDEVGAIKEKMAAVKAMYEPAKDDMADDIPFQLCNYMSTIEQTKNLMYIAAANGDMQHYLLLEKRIEKLLRSDQQENQKKWIIDSRGRKDCRGVIRDNVEMGK